MNEPWKIAEESRGLIIYTAKRCLDWNRVKQLGLISDVVQEGKAAIAFAYSDYNSDRGNLSTYLYMIIRNALQKSDTSKLLFTVSTPIGLYSNIKSREQKQLNKAEKVTLKKAQRAMKVIYLHQPGKSGSRYLLSKINVSDQGEFEKKMLDNVEASLIKECMAYLATKEYEILTLRWDQSCTLQEIGDMLGITKERVRQLEERAIDKIRKVMSGKISIETLGALSEKSLRAVERYKRCQTQ